MQKNLRKLLEDIGNLLRKKGWTISTAESCTGGLISSFLTSIPGSSDYFAGGIIAYSNEIKTNLLSVSPQTLKKFGTVSEETVKDMAQGVKHLLKTDVGISISGIAGPTGGTEKKPVGTVALGVDIPQKIITNMVNLEGNRNNIRKLAGIRLLEMLKNLLEEIK
ncbi:CinA family protein [candidate division WOR-3 bacterium]|nr:CinA family protein [candidate division WOR-3 bacterium]